MSTTETLTLADVPPLEEVEVVEYGGTIKAWKTCMDGWRTTNGCKPWLCAVRMARIVGRDGRTGAGGC